MKKSLTIATIVMVLVLAVSLTTATYAWFSATASAIVETVRLEATAADGLLIGALGTSTVQANRTYTDYRYGDVIWNKTSGVWTGESYMGTNLNFQVPDPANSESNIDMTIGASKAVSYTTTAITATGDGTNISANSWYKANGDANVLDTNSLAQAFKQEDYIDFDLAVTASKANSVKQAYLTLLVTPTAGAQIKMAAAIHFYIELYSGSGPAQIVTANYTASSRGNEAYPGKTQNQNFSQDVTAGTYTASAATNGTTDGQHDLGAGAWYYVVPLYNSDTAMTPFTDLIQVRIIVWIEGTDDACIIANAGTGADIDIFFDYSNSQEWEFASDSGSELLEGRMTAKA